MPQKNFFIAATGQHIGKTTTCLGLISGLQKMYPKRVGFIKPIGQEHIEIHPNIHVDKDVALFKNYFNLPTTAASMSPVLFYRGFTRDFLDGKTSTDILTTQITTSFSSIKENTDVIVIEGTGHVGVGSIVNLSNAKVASLLKVPIILIASGGLGSCFDALAINKALCDAEGVRIAGIILNRVHNDKREMVLKYMEKALKKWGIPILGCIPFDPFLSNPTMQDYELLFNTNLLTGQDHHMLHFRRIRLVATSLKTYQDLIINNQLIITPANRDDIILSTITKYWDLKIENPNKKTCIGMILTGSTPPKHSIIKSLKKADIPTIYVPVSAYRAMELITSYTVKIRTEDTEKIQEAIELVESNIDFKKLLSQV